jgi:acetyltransferase-like isoleucine patch superfamily enzyme
LSKIDSSRRPHETNEKGDVVIGSDVWVGYGATIIGPVTIGDGAIIGAGALVISDIPAYAVAVGVPAKIVKYRFEEQIIKKLLTVQWWNWSLEKIKKEKDLLYSKNIQVFIDTHASL